MSKLLATFGANPAPERGTAGSLDASDDGNWIVYPAGKSVILRDQRNPNICDAYTDHMKTVNVARFSPNGQWVASGDAGGAVRMWGATTAEKNLKKETPVLGGGVFDLAWDAEGKRLIAGGDGGKTTPIKAFNAETGSSLGEMTGHQKPVTSVAVRPTTKDISVLSGSQDMKVGFYKGPPFKFVTSVAVHSNFVLCVRYAPNGALAVSVGADKQIFLIDANTGDAKGTLDGAKNHDGSIYSCSFSPDSKQLLTVSGDKTAKLWDVERQTVVSTFDKFGSGTEDMQVACAWSKNNGRPVSLSLGGDICFIDPASGNLTRVQAFSGEPTCLAYDGESTYVGDTTGAVNRFSGAGLGARVEGPGHTGSTVCDLAAVTGRAYSAGFDDIVRSIEGAAFKGGSASVGGQAHMGAGKDGLVGFATAKKAGVVSDGRVVGSIDLDFEGTAAGLSNDGAFLLVGNKEAKSVVVYAVADKGAKITKTDKVLPDLLGPATVISFSPDGKLVAVGDTIKELSLWETGTFAPKVRQRLVFHTSRISCISWSPDSKYIATGSLDNMIFIWNAATLARAKIPFAHKGGVVGLAWTSATEIVSTGIDRTVRRWAPELP